MSPSSSVTVSVTAYWPTAVNVWVGSASVLVLPSPKSHAYEVMVPSRSKEFSEVNSTTNGALPSVAVAPIEAVGG